MSKVISVVVTAAISVGAVALLHRTDIGKKILGF